MCEKGFWFLVTGFWLRLYSANLEAKIFKWGNEKNGGNGENQKFTRVSHYPITYIIPLRCTFFQRFHDTGYFGAGSGDLAGNAFHRGLEQADDFANHLFFAL